MPAAVTLLLGNDSIVDYPAPCAVPPHPAHAARHKSAPRLPDCASLAALRGEAAGGGVAGGGLDYSEGREVAPSMERRIGREFVEGGRRGSQGLGGVRNGEDRYMRGRDSVDMDALWADPVVGGGNGEGHGGADDEEPPLERLDAISRHSTAPRSLDLARPATGKVGKSSLEGIPRPQTAGHRAQGAHDAPHALRNDGAAKVHPRTRALRASHHRRWASFDGSNGVMWEGEDNMRAHSAENSARSPWGGAAEQQLQSALLPDNLLRDSSPSASAVAAACPKPSVRRTRTRSQRQTRASAGSQLQMRSRSQLQGGSGNQSDGEVDGGGALDGSSDDDELFRPMPPRALGGFGARSGRWGGASGGERGSVLEAWQQRELAQVEEKLRHAGDGGGLGAGALAGGSQRRGMDGQGEEGGRLGGVAVGGDKGKWGVEAEEVGAAEGNGSGAIVRGAQDDALANDLMTRGLLDDAERDAREDGGGEGEGEEGRRRTEQGNDESVGEGRGGEEDGGGREAGGEGMVEGAEGQEDGERDGNEMGEERGEDGGGMEGGCSMTGAEGEGDIEANTAEVHTGEEGEEQAQQQAQGQEQQEGEEQGEAHGEGGGGGGGSRLGQLLRNGTFRRTKEGEERHGSRLARVATAVRAGLKSSSSFNARRHPQQHEQQEQQQQQQQQQHLQEQQQEGKGFEGLAAPKRVQFQMPELEFATDGFAAENILGEGGFGKVYRGLLPVAPRVEVAVKVLKQLGVAADEEFHTELELLSRLDHKNLVRLHGFCSSAHHRMLVYEFLPNGSLTDHLHGPPGAPELSWERRVRIAAGAARGLAHLHRQRPQILHRDVKAPNILLTTNFTAKVADFGCAKLIRRTEVVEDPLTGRQVERLCDSVDYAMGTPGHMAPEMLMTGEISAATDVYSFGVVLLQLVSGRLPIDAAHQQLTHWAAPLLEEQRWEELLDPRLQRALLGRAGLGGVEGREGGAGAGAGELRRLLEGRSVSRCLQLAASCLDMDPLQRPSMEDVALALLAIYSSACAERDEALQPALEGSRSGRTLPPAGPSDPTRGGGGGGSGVLAGHGGAMVGRAGGAMGGSARMAGSAGGMQGFSESPERTAGVAQARFQRNRSARQTSVSFG
ncbi:hypothetical protein CLOM_g24004 [Closterium sp. NIES-68]|nr:hypothetical protein CLOM_g24004 [Closterium sp. NIES-68]